MFVACSVGGFKPVDKLIKIRFIPQQLAAGRDLCYHGGVLLGYLIELFDGAFDLFMASACLSTALVTSWKKLSCIAFMVLVTICSRISVEFCTSLLLCSVRCTEAAINSSILVAASPPFSPVYGLRSMTTANFFPGLPALPLPTAAFKARRLVWKAISSTIFTSSGNL